MSRVQTATSWRVGLSSVLVLCLLGTSASVRADGTALAPPGAPQAQATEVQEEDPTLKVAAVSAGVLATAMLVGTFAWWRDAGYSGWGWDNSGFFGSGTYAGGADKTGHFFSNYVTTRAAAAIYRKMGVPPTAAAGLATAVVFSVAAVVEIVDGFTPHGFEWPDVVANGIGAGMGLLAELSPTFASLAGFRIAYFPTPQFLHEEQGYVEAVNDYSGMYFHADFKPSGLEESFGISAGPARYLLVGAIYGTDGYSPEVGEKERNVGLYVGLNVPVILSGLFGESAVVDAAAAFTSYYALPFTGVGTITDMNHGGVSSSPGTANRFEYRY